jgi:cytosine deaminase
MNLKDYGIAVGNPADIVVLDCADPVSAVAELAQPVLGMKGGRVSFRHAPATLNRPEGMQISAMQAGLTA